MGDASAVVLEAFAPAKVNLSLRVIARRPDGYHELVSLVTFASVGDRLTLTPGPALTLDVVGPTAAVAGAGADNLVLMAARSRAERVATLRAGHFRLSKRLPVAAGIGGGSADAAAALRLLVRLWSVEASETDLLDLAAGLGADVPACLLSRTVRGGGRGDRLEPVELGFGGAPLLLVNPGVALSTADVFRRWSAPGSGPLAADLGSASNDLEEPAVELAPAIGAVLGRLRDARGALLVRMSGSGATCFALFESEPARDRAAAEMHVAEPGWWQLSTRLA
jgi:4-diphosphocytidyl-2-C-methyl-D-erythritol kinase